MDVLRRRLKLPCVWGTEDAEIKSPPPLRLESRTIAGPTFKALSMLDHSFPCFGKCVFTNCYNLTGELVNCVLDPLAAGKNAYKNQSGLFQALFVSVSYSRAV